MGGREWRVAEIKDESMGRIRVAYRMARCVSGPCIIAAYSLGREARLAIIPAQPSPFCVRGDRVDAIVARWLLERTPASYTFVPSVCRVPRRLLRPSLAETLQHLTDIGLLEEG